MTKKKKKRERQKNKQINRKEYWQEEKQKTQLRTDRKSERRSAIKHNINVLIWEGDILGKKGKYHMWPKMRIIFWIYNICCVKQYCPLLIQSYCLPWRVSGFSKERWTVSYFLIKNSNIGRESKTIINWRRLCSFVSFSWRGGGGSFAISQSCLDQEEQKKSYNADQNSRRKQENLIK